MSDKAETGETAEIDVGEPMAAPERSGSVEQTEGRGPSGRVGRTEGRGPFAGLSPKPMRRLLIVSGAITLLLFIALAVIDLRIKRSGGAGGGR